LAAGWGGEGKALAGDRVKLPAARVAGGMSVAEALATRRSRRSFTEEPLHLAAAGQLLWAAQGLSDQRHGLRTCPSAGATYPLEAYLVAGAVTGLPAGVYRYLPASHELIMVRAGDVRRAVAAAALGQEMLAVAPATLVLAAEYGRTARRYGARAPRYVQMEVGHAGENVYLQCVALGLGTCAVGAFDDAELKAALGIAEEPLYLLPIGRPR
jgi:SagB-type dehydrogenase family enzyme